MSPKLKDIAAELGLTVGTVSKVLNRLPGTRVSDETRRRIEMTAHRLGYRPNAHARALRCGKTLQVAMVIRRDALLIGAVEALAEGLGTVGYDLLVKVFAEQDEILNALQNLSRSQSCDAVILWGQEEEVSRQGQLLQTLGLPFVAKGRHEESHPEWLQIEFDHEAMMEAVVRHFSERGHRRIAYLGFDADSAFRYRLRDGFERAMERLMGHPVRGDFLAELPSDQRRNEAQMERWLSLSVEERPTAVAVGSGNQAWEGIETALARHGWRIGDGPSEVAVAGQSHNGHRLLYGHGLAFQDIATYHLAAALCHRILIPLLSKEALPDPVVRVLPELRPLPSRELLLRT